MLSNADIAACARGWVGTRFHHQGRLKKTASHGGGVDCLGLLVGVAQELDLRKQDGAPLAALDQTDYGHYPDTEYLQKKLTSALYPVGVSHITQGYIVLFAIEQAPQHLAIISDLGGRMGMIHAYAPARAVVEHELDEAWRARIVAAYRYF